MEEKLRFVFEHELQERTMTELCERCEITRQTGYVWLRRYCEAGVAGLMEHSRAAHRHRNQMPEDLEQPLLPSPPKTKRPGGNASGPSTIAER